MYDLHEFLEPINPAAYNNDQGYNDGQLANFISAYEEELPDLEETDIVLVGINGNEMMTENNAPNAIRKHFYQLNYWHTDTQIADIGNIKAGATLNDSYAAIKTVLAELLKMNKTVVLLGGSHDITLAQYATGSGSFCLLTVALTSRPFFFSKRYISSWYTFLFPCQGNPPGKLAPPPTNKRL